MIKTISRMFLTYGIISIFLLTSLTPLTQSITFSTLGSDVPTLSSVETAQSINNQTPSQRSPDGLAPKTPTRYTIHQPQRCLNRNEFYAYCAYGGPAIGPVTYDTPDTLTLLAPGVFPNFCGGADMDNNGNWYGCDYAGGLYSIDPDTGSQTYIAPTISVNGMTYDGTTQTWYVTSTYNLYTMDVTTGATILVGTHGTTNTIIGIACNLHGDMYGYDALWTGDSTLYSIDKTTGTATAIGPMGYGMVYAQDCNFDRDNDILYISAYFNDGSPSALLTCDYSTGTCTPVGNFQGGAEIDGDAIPWTGVQYDHDIAVSGIIKPATGNAGPITPIVKIKNTGNNTETNIPLQLTIGKELITGTLEDFEATNGSYIHFAKNTDSWQWGAPTTGPGAAHSGSNLWATILNGNYPSNMWSGLMTQPFVVPSGINFKFWHWYQFESGWDGGNVKISTDGGVTFSIIIPMGGYPGTLSSNPYMNGQPGYTGTGGTTWTQAVFDLTAYEGMTVIILWETASDASDTYAGWYIDDVGFTETSWVTEYNQTSTIASIAPEEVIELSFPTWTPIDLGLVENNNINYNAEATTMLAGDQNLNNDYKEKAFTLHYGYSHDVAVTQIVSPTDGLAQTQTPEVVIENHGQNPENINVSMTIGKALYTTLLEEDFAGSVPPAGWGTNYPTNWISSSTNYAGGESPEASFSWSPSSVGEHYLWTSSINTTGFTALSLKFKEYVNDYNSGYTLKVVTSTDGGATWNDAYVRAGGPYGPTTTTITLSTANGVGSANFQIAWDMSGDSFNINYWYIDDVWIGIIDFVEEYNQTVPADINPGETLNVLLPDWTPANIPFVIEVDYLIDTSVSMNTSDGNPTDNEMAKMITLNYEHDVGIIAITQPSESAPKDEDWLQYDNGVYANSFGSTTGHIYGANRFTIDEQLPYIGWKLDMIRWKHYGDVAFSGTIHVYGEGTSSTPGPEIISETFSITGDDWFEVPLPGSITLDGSDLWLCVEGTHNTGEYPLECSAPGISLKTAFYSSDGATWYDLPGLGYDVAFEIRGHVQSNGGENNWFPGTYPVEGVIQNLGVTYTEADIPVNTQLTNDTGVVVYDETVIVTGPLTPSETTFVTFPTFTIPMMPEAGGDYKLTMKTMFTGDDHPSNDKKILYFYIYAEPPPPYPETTATVSGTIGDNDWYISCVTITLTAIDGKWPPGVDYTLYKVDNGEWTEYTTPIVVCDDGHHTVYFYSVYTDGSSEEVKSVSFKIDQTPPTIEMSVEEVNFHEWTFTANVTDKTSGIAMVQCFIDNMLLGDIVGPGPYQWLWNGKGEHTVEGIAYDNAGNSAESAVTFSLSHETPPHPFLSHVIQLIMRFLERIKTDFPLMRIIPQ